MRTVLLDFDGTLAERPGLWSQCLLEVLDERVPGHGATRDDIREHLRDGLPWHRPDETHLELCEPERWWAEVGAVIARCFRSCGVGEAEVPALVDAFRARYCDPGGFRLFDDTVPALEALRAAGWKTVVLSNHVPELEGIVDGLGLSPLVDDVICSAVIGYEKPHPEAFRIALGGIAPSNAWMVGDNPEADVRGAEAFGIASVLVRRADPGVSRQAADLLDAASLILDSPAR